MIREKRCNCCVFREELRLSKGKLVLVHDKVYRLLGISEDDMDWYWIYETLHGVLEYHSCVGDFIDLASYIPHDRYEYLDNLFRLNQKWHAEDANKNPMEDITETLRDKCYCSSLYSDEGLRRHVAEVKQMNKIRKDLIARGIDPDSPCSSSN